MCNGATLLDVKEFVRIHLRQIADLYAELSNDAIFLLASPSPLQLRRSFVFIVLKFWDVAIDPVLLLPSNGYDYHFSEVVSLTFEIRIRIYMLNNGI